MSMPQRTASGLLAYQEKVAKWYENPANNNTVLWTTQEEGIEM